MNTTSRRALRGFASVSAATLTAALAGQALAQTQAPAANGAKPEVEVQEVVVTAVKGKAAEAAPVKSNLKATEPQAVITRQFIEESAPRVGDYTTTAILAPSMATTPNPNGSGATDGAKISLRGFKDGEFNVTYDGIAWGDTNGPSHHSNSFFPSSVIGGVVIDRGPGRASDFGQANFGGSVNLFSLPFEDRLGVRQTATVASFGTYQAVTTFTTGPVAKLFGANFVLNFMEYSTDGYLSNSPSSGQNQFIKGTLPINDKWSITALYTRNEDDYNQGDASASATVYQTATYGKRFALSNDPTVSTFKDYNYTRKQTDFEYIRLDGDLGRGLKLENTVYSYDYANHTLSANNNGADYSLDPGYVPTAALPYGPNLRKLLVANIFPNNTPNLAYPAPGKAYTTQAPGSAAKAGTLTQTYGIPGYTKRNEYRVTGDILRFHQDTPWGKLSFGGLYEHAFTQRERFDYVLGTATGTPLGLGTFDFREKAATFPNGASAGHCNYPLQANGACQIPLNIAYSEFSGWDQYQPFAEFEWKATDALTITPGVKYVNFKLNMNAPAIQTIIQPTYLHQTVTKTLPFLTANYRFRSNWSFYAQYAQGMLVPNISSLYVNAPLQNRLQPQESTNYQIGTVFSAGNLTFDADIYYIDFKHKIQTFTISDATSPLNGESYQTNSGGATYKGIELQGTYLLPYGFSTFGNFTVNQATANGDPVNPGGNGKQLANVPRGTAAFGLRYERRGLLTADDRLVSNLNTKWIGQQWQTGAKGAVAPTVKLNAFNETNWTTTYRISHYSVEFQVLNLFNHQDITSAKGSQFIGGTNQLDSTNAFIGTTPNSNTFTYQVQRSYQLTLKAAF